MTVLVNLRITRRFDAAPERVFDAWLDPKVAGRWLFTTRASEKNVTEMDPRLGGRWSITDTRDGVDYTALGEYRVIDRPRRLIFSFGMPQFSPVSCAVTVEIVPDGAGCILTLSQEGVTPADQKPLEQGWSEMFDALVVALEVRCGFGVVVAPRTLRFERLLPGPIERVWAYLAESDKRARWLASGDIEPRVGAALRFRFNHADLSPHVAPPPEASTVVPDGLTLHSRLTRFEPPHVLGFIWDIEADPSEVVVELTPVGDRVRLVLTQGRLADREAMISVASGWHAHLTILNERLNGRAPPPFWPLHGDLEEAYEVRIS